MRVLCTVIREKLDRNIKSMTDFFKTCKFHFSVANLEELPRQSLGEIVFAGRSNSGKSSVINALTGKKNLAKSSKTPGRTQLINFFSIRESLFLVDLPGYGYAKAPKGIKKSWETLLATYLIERTEILGLVLIMDIRHPLQDRDLALFDIFLPTGKPIFVILNKADKLSRQQALFQQRKIEQNIKSFYLNSSVLAFSAIRGMGVQSAKKLIHGWLT